MGNVTVDAERLVALWNEGTTIRELSELLGVSHSTITNFVRLHREQCPHRSVGRPKKINDSERMIDLWKDGVSISGIAQELNISTSTVNKFLASHRSQCPLRYTGRNNLKGKKEEFVQMWNEGVPKDKMAKHFQSTVSAISEYAARNRIECPAREKGWKKKQ